MSAGKREGNCGDAKALSDDLDCCLRTEIKKAGVEIMENKSTVMAEYDSKYELYKKFTLEIEHQLRNILDAEGIVYNAVTCRLKGRESLSKKIDRKNDKYSALEDLTDIAGVRVITYYAEDVDKVAEIVGKQFTIDKENSIDKRDALEPDRFGYCSVHYVVEMSQDRLQLREYQAFRGLKCEIQIRSVLQHAWAEIEHDLGYKSEIAIPKGIRRNFSRLAGLLEIADKEFQEIRSFLQSYQNEAPEKVKSEEFQDAEIDAILLQAIITTNPDIAALNEAIGNYFHCPVSSEILTESLESTINTLHWHGIYTVSQLNACIKNNKNNAAIIAEKFSKISQKYAIMSIDTEMLITAALSYICYAEMIKKNLDYDQIMQYFTDNNISSSGIVEDFVRCLLQLSKE